MIHLTTIGLHSDTLLDFDQLKARGWVHPKGIGKELMLNCLEKSKTIYSYLLVSHSHRDSREYQEIFLYPKDNDGKVLLKGRGKGLPAEGFIQELATLMAELSACQKGTAE